MAEYAGSIFNKKATEKLRSPDDLDKYVQVTNPSVWVVFAACVSLLAGLLAWGVFGSVTTSVSATGAVVDGKAYCFLSAEDAADVAVGDIADIGGVKLEVAQVARVPVSVAESKDVLRSDYLVSALMKSDWAYTVFFDGDVSELDEGVPLKVNITTSRIAPISLVLKGWS